MKKSNEKVADSQGEIPTHDQIVDQMKRDLGTALGLMNALLMDSDLLNQTAVFIRGRMENAKVSDNGKS